MIVLKILAAPFVVVLTVLAAVVSFLFCMATAATTYLEKHKISMGKTIGKPLI